MPALKFSIALIPKVQFREITHNERILDDHAKSLKKQLNRKFPESLRVDLHPALKQRGAVVRGDLLNL